MKTSDAFNLIVQIEDSVDTDVFEWKGFITWPLVRQMLWVELTSVASEGEVKTVKKRYAQKALLSLERLVLIARCLFSDIGKRKDSSKIFISRPVYLEEIGFERLFDRVVDPIIESLGGNEKITKYYVSKTPKKKKLVHKSLMMCPGVLNSFAPFTDKQKTVLCQIEYLSGISALELQDRYKKMLKTFIRWFFSAKRTLSKQKNLKEIYLTSWYFPDMMGICAAASTLGIETIDVQHGKQGKYQAMYSGWNKIPDEGYDLMPDVFWCWGQTSCNHILTSSPSRRTHLPFVGGYPWIDYYKKHLMPDSCKPSGERPVVLVTLQPPQGLNTERIPNFIVDFLLSADAKDVYFIFRLHPNDKTGARYCRKRLDQVSAEIYSIDRGSRNLYDVFCLASYHITAYSSCCYEAKVFNIPTLLYGSESQEIYRDEIRDNIFAWTNSDVRDLKAWLNQAPHEKFCGKKPYIETSCINV